jgi:hypothetical protein
VFCYAVSVFAVKLYVNPFDLFLVANLVRENVCLTFFEVAFAFYLSCILFGVLICGFNSYPHQHHICIGDCTEFGFTFVGAFARKSLQYEQINPSQQFINL